MPNNYLSVLYKHIIQVENKNVGLKVGGTNIPLPPNQKSVCGGGSHVSVITTNVQRFADESSVYIPVENPETCPDILNMS